jgi:hypothetical protein
MANRLDVIIKNIEEETCLQIDVAMQQTEMSWKRKEKRS